MLVKSLNEEEEGEGGGREITKLDLFSNLFLDSHHTLRYLHKYFYELLGNVIPSVSLGWDGSCSYFGHYSGMYTI